MNRHSDEYREYLESPAWRELRYRILTQRGRRCEACGDRGVTLQVHHRNYERLGHEEPEDLQILCVRCHREADLTRKVESAERRWERRVSSWAAVVSGAAWAEDVSFARAEEDFERWLRRRGEL